MKDLASFSIYSADTLFLRGAASDPQFREPVGLSGGGLADAIQGLEKSDPEAYQKLGTELHDSIGWLEIFVALSLSKNSPGGETPSLSPARLLFGDRYFRRNKAGAKHILTANQVNEGTLYLLFVAVLCLHKSSPKLFAIENVDHGLNPLLARHLVSTICKWLLDSTRAQQVLLTTHNPLVLDGLPLSDERIRLFTVDRDNRGTTQIKRFKVTEDIRKMATEKGWTLSRMWVNKLIGGVPDV
jgi:predicted ATPase